MATVISGQKSTYGSPYAFYTLDLSCNSRTATSAVISYTLKVNLQYSSSTLGKGYALTAIIYAGGSNSGEITLKPSSTSWTGTSVKTFTGSFTVTGLSPSTTLISTALYSSAYYGGKYRACIRPAVSGSNLSIPEQTKYTITYNANGGSGAPPSQSYYYGGNNINLSTTIPTRSGYNFLGWSLSSTATSPSYYAGQAWSSSNASNYTLYAVWEVANGKSTISLSQSNINLNDNITVFINTMNAGNYHKIVWSYGSNSFTSHKEATDNITLTLFESRFSSWFGTEKSINIKVTVTTYNSSGSSLGESVAAFNLNIPESLGKPSIPAATVTSKTLSGATIKLTKPATFKYGATFKEWQVTSNVGEISISGDTATGIIDPSLNKTAVATIYAVDSRGFLSDPVYVVWSIRRKGACVYSNGISWNSTIPYIYINGQWVKCDYMLYTNSSWISDNRIKTE